MFVVVAYTMAKYGMSLCVLGMSEELRADGIAVNALWPKTGINLSLKALSAISFIMALFQQIKVTVQTNETEGKKILDIRCFRY